MARYFECGKLINLSVMHLVLQRSYTQHGKVLGGGSSVNWMIYARGHKDDYDSWEQKGCEGWGWGNVKEYFKKMENYFMRDRGLVLF